MARRWWRAYEGDEGPYERTGCVAWAGPAYFPSLVKLVNSTGLIGPMPADSPKGSFNDQIYSPPDIAISLSLLTMFDYLAPSP
jgi:hypothetical protein